MYLVAYQLQVNPNWPAVDVPFAWSSLHWHPAELTPGADAFTAGTLLETRLGGGITSYLDNIGQRHRTSRERPTFFRLHSSQARETFDRFLGVVVSACVGSSVGLVS